MSEAHETNANGTEGDKAKPPVVARSPEKGPPTVDEKPKDDIKAKEGGKEAEKPKAPEDGKQGAKKEPRKLTGDEDELPEDDELFTLSKAALEKRMARAGRKELRDRFGTDDHEKIKADLAELKTLREEREAARLAQLSKEERLEAEKAAAEKKAADAEAKLSELEDKRDISQVDRQFAKIGEKHLAAKWLDKDSWREALYDELRVHLREETDGDPKKVTDKMVEKFFEKYAKDNPEVARKAAEKPVEVEIDSGSKVVVPPGNETKPKEETSKLGTRPKAEINKAGYRW